jgi:hypothetical protein
MITQARLHELFIYDAGKLLRRTAVKGSPAMTEIGTTKPEGYRVAVVDGKMYRLHHLVWLYHRGEFASELDHINRKRSDNRIENLRSCTHSQNLGNARARVHKYKGVTFCKATKKWRAQLNGHLGRFDTIEEAALAYNAAALEHFGEFAHLNKVM